MKEIQRKKKEKEKKKKERQMDGHRKWTRLKHIAFL